MYIIIWEYQVRVERLTEFEEIYAADGAWAELFQKDEGFLGTQLLRDTKTTGRYITIDRWQSSAAYEDFLRHWRAEYAALDQQCENLTENEIFQGSWETISRETR